MKTQTLILTAGLAAFVVRADYVKLIASDPLYASSGTDKHSSIVDIPDFNPGRWSNGLRLYKDYDYYIGSWEGASVYACTPNIAGDTATHVFSGKSLTLNGFDREGADGIVIKHVSKASSVMDYTAAPVYLQSGIYQFLTDGPTMKMNATVLSPESNPFVFLYDNPNDASVSWVVNRKMYLNLTGESGTAVRLNRPASATSTMQWILEECKSSAFKGALEVENLFVAARGPDTFELGGKLRLLQASKFHPLATFGEGKIGEIELAGGTLSLDSGSVVPGKFTSNGGVIDFAGFHCANPSGTAYAAMRVVESAALEKTTKIVIGGGDTLYLGETCERGEWPLIEFPQGADVSVEDFELSLNVTISGMTPDVIKPFWSLVVKDNANGAPTLYAVREKVVVSQDPNYAEHPINDGTKWKSGAAPEAGAAYFAYGSSGKTYVPVDYASFGGDHLYCYANQIKFLCPSFEVRRLTFLAGSAGIYTIWCNPASLRIHGGIFECLKELGSEPVTFVQNNTGATALEIASDIVGPGTLSFNYRNQSTEMALRTLTLTGTNDKYSGTMWINADLTVNVANGTAFGGALDTVTYDAVRFTKCSNGTNPYKLVPMAPVSFDEPTRGWLIGGKVDFSPTEECPLTVRNPITILGGQEKSGAGVLALGGPLKFSDSFSDEPGTATDYYLAIRDGWIKPLAADAFNGLRIYFDADSDGIELDWNATGDVRAYGLRNTKAVKVLHFQFVNDKTIQVRFDVGGLTEFPGGEHTFGLLTVPTAEADAVFGHVKVAKPFKGIRPVLSKRNNGDGTTTLVADCKRLGLIITVK